MRLPCSGSPWHPLCWLGSQGLTDQAWRTAPRPHPAPASWVVPAARRDSVGYTFGLGPPHPMPPKVLHYRAGFVAVCGSSRFCIAPAPGAGEGREGLGSYLAVSQGPSGLTFHVDLTWAG